MQKKEGSAAGAAVLPQYIQRRRRVSIDGVVRPNRHWFCFKRSQLERVLDGNMLNVFERVMFQRVLGGSASETAYCLRYLWCCVLFCVESHIFTRATKRQYVRCSPKQRSLVGLFLNAGSVELRFLQSGAQIFERHCISVSTIVVPWSWLLAWVRSGWYP